MREDGGDVEASYFRRTGRQSAARNGPSLNEGMLTWALDIHEVRVWRLHQSLLLVLLGLLLGVGVEEIDS